MEMRSLLSTVLPRNHMEGETTEDGMLDGQPPAADGVDVYEMYPHKISDLSYNLVGAYLFFIWIIGTIFNVLSLLVFFSNKQLRSPTNMFIVSLNFCDLCMSVFPTLLAFTSAWSGVWLFGRWGCIIDGFAVYFLGMASMCMMCAISFDRYIVIAKPLIGAKINHTVAGVAIAACWLGGFLWAAFPLFGWNTYQLEGAGISCSIVWETTNNNYKSYIFAVFFFCLILPLGIIIFSYYGVWRTIRSMSAGANFDKESRIGKRNMKVERKMVKTIFIMVGTYLACWAPYAIFSFLVIALGPGVISPELATYPAIIAKSQGIFNPIIYVASNKMFRKAFYAMLPCGGLRATLEKREEGKDSDDEDDDDNKSKSHAGVSRSNKVAPSASAVKEVVCGEETVLEDLEAHGTAVAPAPSGSGQAIEPSA